MKSLRKHLPLFYVLSELKDYQRQIIINALSNDADKAIIESISFLLKNGKKLPVKKSISRCVRDNKTDIQCLLNKNKQAAKLYKKKLTKLGGNPIGFILSAVLPLILNKLIK